jgi:iron complex transport system ATP-binding protein
MAAVELAELRVELGGRPVLRGISARVEPGALVAVVGPNGAGKSTLLRAIAGLVPAAVGAVRCLGRDPARAERRALARELAYLPQHYELAFPYAALEVVLLGRYAHQRGLGLASAADLAAAHDAMAACEVADLAERRFDELSGGEARRVLIAQALCQGARCLLLDEPTAGLDPAHARAVLTTLRARCDAGATALVATHDLDLALRTATTIWLCAAGELTAQGTPAEVLGSAAAQAAFGLPLHLGTLPSGTRFAVPA